MLRRGASSLRLRLRLIHQICPTEQKAVDSHEKHKKANSIRLNFVRWSFRAFLCLFVAIPGMGFSVQVVPTRSDPGSTRHADSLANAAQNRQRYICPVYLPQASTVRLAKTGIPAEKTVLVLPDGAGKHE